jgi:hypothetical protein
LFIGSWPYGRMTARITRLLPMFSGMPRETTSPRRRVRSPSSRGAEMEDAAMATRQTSKQNEPACARHGLSAGGRWIRTNGPGREKFASGAPCSFRTRRQQLGEKSGVCPRSGGSDQGVTLDEFPNQYRAELNVRILLPPVESRANSGSEMGSASTAPCGCCDARQGSMWVAVGHKRVSPIYNLVARGDAAARSIKRGSPPAGTLCDPPVGAHCFKSRALAKPVAGPVPSRPSFVTTVGED